MMEKLLNKDEEGSLVVPNTHPGVGTVLAINGNLYRIIYSRDKGEKFTAEYAGEHEPKNDIS